MHLTVVLAMHYPCDTMQCAPSLEQQERVLAALQALLACVWVFNIGAVLVWMPWLYRWQCQPTADK